MGILIAALVDFTKHTLSFFKKCGLARVPFAWNIQVVWDLQPSTGLRINRAGIFWAYSSFLMNELSLLMRNNRLANEL